jgi:uncharacterized membrane protein
MMVWAWLLGIVVGFVSCFFVMRNNPKYFNIDDMLKVKKAEVLKELEAKKDMTIEEIKKIVDKVF